MSQKINHRRGGKRHQDNGPTWEGGPPNSGSNSTHVARSRKKWKRIGVRAERRTDGRSTGGFMGKPRWAPEDVGASVATNPDVPSMGTIDAAFEAFDGALRRGEWGAVDRLLEAFDFAGVHTDLAVVVLMATKPAKEHLAARGPAVDRFARRLREEAPERADSVLRWL